MTEHEQPEGDRTPVHSSLLEYLHACPICSGADMGHYCRVPSLFEVGEFIHYERCQRCGTVLRNPRLPAGDRLARYEEKIMPSESKELNEKSQAHYAYMMRILERNMPADGGRRLLDFGCGAGGFLLEAQALGFDVMGLEINRDLARHVETIHGLPVFQGQLSDSEFASERFDVVISSQVFEHLLDPRGTLATLRRVLTGPGLLLIEVPSLLDLRERLRRGSMMDDSHLFYFTPRSLSRMMRDQGFRVLKVQQGLRPHRFASRAARTWPLWVSDLGQRIASLAQVKTGLSIVASLPQP